MNLQILGVTSDGKQVLGGAFQFADTNGFPLWVFMDAAKAKNAVVSIPHYFASAMEHGWDDIQTFGKIKEAIVDSGNVADMDSIKSKLISQFMGVARTMPGKSAVEIGKRMRELLETSAP